MTASRPEGAKGLTRETIARVGQAAFERNAVGRTIPENWLKAADAILALCVEYAREQVEDYESALQEEHFALTNERTTLLLKIAGLEDQLQTLRELVRKCSLIQLARWLRAHEAVWDPDDPPVLIGLADDLERLAAALESSQ